MNLLKIFVVVVLTASISFFLSSNVLAVDHPWDDDKIDTTTIVGSNPSVDGNSNPESPITIVSRVSEWARLFFLEIKSVLLGEVKNDRGIKPSPVNTWKSKHPTDRKK